MVAYVIERRGQLSITKFLHTYMYVKREHMYIYIFSELWVAIFLPRYNYLRTVFVAAGYKTGYEDGSTR